MSTFLLDHLTQYDWTTWLPNNLRVILMSSSLYTVQPIYLWISDTCIILTPNVNVVHPWVIISFLSPIEFSPPYPHSSFSSTSREDLIIESEKQNQWFSSRRIKPNSLHLLHNLFFQSKISSQRSEFRLQNDVKVADLTKNKAKVSAVEDKLHWEIRICYW